MHIIGTSIVLGIVYQFPKLVFAAIAAGSIGTLACGAFAGFSNGALEALFAFATFLTFGKQLSGSLRVPLAVLLIGYAFAWVGHFFYEENRPASFIYPAFSLMGDFAMFADVILGREGINFKK